MYSLRLLSCAAGFPTGGQLYTNNMAIQLLIAVGHPSEQPWFLTGQEKMTQASRPALRKSIDPFGFQASQNENNMPGTIASTFSPTALRKQRQMNLCHFVACLVYMVVYRQAMST